MKKAALLFLIIASVPLHAHNDGSQIVPIALPDTPGAGGSIWVSKHYLHNHSDEPLWVTNNMRPCQFSAEHACDAQLPPRSTTEVSLLGIHRPFDVWHVTEGDPRAFSITTVVRNTASDVDPWGTSIPTPAAADYFSGSFHVAPVTVDPAYRVSLRIYSIPQEAALTSVTVEIWQYDDIFTGSVQLVDTLILPPVPYEGSELYGSYFETHDLFRGLTEGSDDARALIRVRASDSEQRLWGFASVTHNVTHHVTIFAP